MFIRTDGMVAVASGTRREAQYWGDKLHSAEILFSVGTTFPRRVVMVGLTRNVEVWVSPDDLAEAREMLCLDASNRVLL